MASPATSAQLQPDVESWLAIDSGRQIVFVLFTWIVYEYFITLDKEVRFHPEGCFE